MSQTRWADESPDDEEGLGLPVPLSTPVLDKISYSPFSRATSRPKTNPHAMGVVVRGLEGEVSESQISRFFQNCEMTNCRINKAKGMAFIEVRSKGGLDRALALDGTKLGKKIVSVTLDRIGGKGVAPKRASRPTEDEKEEEGRFDCLAPAPGLCPAPGLVADARWAFAAEDNKVRQEYRERKERERAERKANGEDEVVEEGSPPDDEKIEAAEEVSSPNERKKLILQPRSADLPARLPGKVEDNSMSKSVARLIRRKAAATAPKVKAPVKQNRFAGLVEDEEEELEEEQDQDDE